ncbi:MAG: hypothetical protein RBU29_08020 [bacterium]|nr:hypothetical protein [bacterium]
MMSDTRTPRRISNRQTTSFAKKTTQSVDKPSDERLKRFADYLENRGCPVRLNFAPKEKEIQWID